MNYETFIIYPPPKKVKYNNPQNINQGLISTFEQLANETGKQYNRSYSAYLGYAHYDEKTNTVRLKVNLYPKSTTQAYGFFNIFIEIIKFCMNNAHIVLPLFAVVLNILDFVKIKIGQTEITIRKDKINVDNPPDEIKDDNKNKDKDGKDGKDESSNNTIIYLAIIGILAFMMLKKQ